jgi:hypothetical protein
VFGATYNICGEGKKYALSERVIIDDICGLPSNSPTKCWMLQDELAYGASMAGCSLGKRPPFCKTAA